MLKWTSIVIIVTSYFLYNYISSTSTETPNIISSTSTETPNILFSEYESESEQVNKDNTIASNILITDKNNSQCLTIEEYKNLEEVIEGNAYIYENLLIANAVDQSLTSLSEDALIRESDSGNAEAMFVLGMNYQWFSHRSSFNNPSLSLRDFNDTHKELDISILKKARFWLWEAALNGVLISIPELANTYKLEDDLGKTFNDELKIKYTLYKALYYKVSPDIAIFENNTAEKQINTLKNLNKNEMSELFEQLSQKWVDDRAEIGLGKYIELPRPPLVGNEKTIIFCNTIN